MSREHLSKYRLQNDKVSKKLIGKRQFTLTPAGTPGSLPPRINAPQLKTQPIRLPLHSILLSEIVNSPEDSYHWYNI